MSKLGEMLMNEFNVNDVILMNLSIFLLKIIIILIWVPMII